jgi:hypothetical protein
LALTQRHLFLTTIFWHDLRSVQKGTLFITDEKAIPTYVDEEFGFQIVKWLNEGGLNLIPANQRPWLLGKMVTLKQFPKSDLLDLVECVVDDKCAITRDEDKAKLTKYLKPFCFGLSVFDRPAPYLRETCDALEKTTVLTLVNCSGRDGQLSSPNETGVYRVIA